MKFDFLTRKNCLQSLINPWFVLLQVLPQSTLEILFSGALMFKTLLNWTPQKIHLCPDEHDGSAEWISWFQFLGPPWCLLSSVNAYLTWFHWKCFPESWRDFDRVFSIVKKYQTAEKFWMILVHQLAGLNHGECMHESSRNFPSWESWEYGGEFSKFWTRNSFRNCHAVTKTVTSSVSKQKIWKIGSVWGLCYNLNYWNKWGKI